jgi:SNF2 family DNA or RNA helicase
VARGIAAQIRPPLRNSPRGQGWSEVPFLIASIDTAKTEKNRDEIGAAGFDLLVVDEAHRLRNHLTQGWKFVDALSLKYLLLLTATPVQNDLRELYNLVTLLKPGLLGTYRSFRKEFMVRGDKRLPKNTRQLARTLSRVMVRTSRSSTSIVFPKREVNIIPFEMTREERKLYDGVADFVREVAEESEPKEFPRWHFLLLVLQKEMGRDLGHGHTLDRSQNLRQDFYDGSWRLAIGRRSRRTRRWRGSEHLLSRTEYPSPSPSSAAP